MLQDSHEPKCFDDVSARGGTRRRPIRNRDVSEKRAEWYVRWVSHAGLYSLFIVGFWFAACSAPSDECDPTDKCPPSDDAGTRPSDDDGPPSDDSKLTAAELWTNCTANADCEGAQVCLPSEGDAYFGGGYPGGVCALPCSSDPEVCSQLPVGSACVETGEDQAVCLRSCEAGSGSAEAPSCGAEETAACEPASNGEGAFCRGFCISDGECAPSRCDLKTGACVDARLEGGELGQPCSPSNSDAAGSTECRGVCADVGTSVGVCSHRCKLGGLSNCGADGIPGVCRFPPPGHRFGDVGFCARLCDQTSDCFPPEVVCEPFAADYLTEMTGYLGVCVPSGAQLE